MIKFIVLYGTTTAAVLFLLIRLDSEFDLAICAAIQAFMIILLIMVCNSDPGYLPRQVYSSNQAQVNESKPLVNLLR